MPARSDVAAPPVRVTVLDAPPAEGMLAERLTSSVAPPDVRDHFIV